MIRGNGARFGAATGAYYNPLQIFPRIVAVSAISPNVNQDTTPTQDVPGTPAAGDEIYAHVMAAGPQGNATFTPPAGEGWQSVSSGWDQTQLDTRAQVFYKIWGDGNIDNVTVTFTSSAPNARLVLMVVRDADTGSAPAGASFVGSSQVGSATPIAPSVIAPPNCLVLHFFEVSSFAVSVVADDGPVYGGPAYLGAAGQDVAMALGALAVPTGSTAAYQATASGLCANGWTTVSVALQGESSVPIIESVSAISADVNSPNASNTIVGTPSAGEIVFAHIVNGGNAVGADPAFTPPPGEGWQTDPLLRSTSQTLFDSTCQVFWKRWGSGSIDNTSVTFTGTTGNSRLVLMRVSGCVASGAPFTSAATASDDASNDMGAIAPALSVPDDGSLVMRFYAATPNGGEAMTLNAPMVEAYDGAAYSFNDGTNGAMAASAQVQAVAGSALPRSARASVKTENGWVGMTIAVAPKPI